MYVITLEGNAPATVAPAVPITKARIYFAADPSVDVDVTPGAVFQAQLTTANAGDYPLAYSWVNANGEGPKSDGQMVNVPDMSLPPKPTAALAVKSVVWA